jgi:hypothetical protein
MGQISQAKVISDCAFLEQRRGRKGGKGRSRMAVCALPEPRGRFFMLSCAHMHRKKWVPFQLKISF